MEKIDPFSVIIVLISILLIVLLIWSGFTIVKGNAWSTGKCVDLGYSYGSMHSVAGDSIRFYCYKVNEDGSIHGPDWFRWKYD